MYYLYATARLRLLGDAIPVLSGLDVKTIQPRLNLLRRYAEARSALGELPLYEAVFEPVFRQHADRYRESGEFDASRLYRYLVGCVPAWCYLYDQNKWYAIDPFVDHALKSTSPVLASEVHLSSPGQERLMAQAAEHGFRSGVVVPAHGSRGTRIGILYLGTDEGPERARESLTRHRNLMRAFALELMEWWDAKLRDSSLENFELDELDIDLLAKAVEGATTEEAAHELGVTLSRARSRYERIARKLEVSGKRESVEKAVALGLIGGHD